MVYVNPKLVIIHWHDAEAIIGWDEYDDNLITDKVIVCSVGWLIAKNEHTTLIMADAGKDLSYNRAMRIPNVCIESIRLLKESNGLAK